MVIKKSGEKISLYFDKNLWSVIDKEAHKLKMTPSEYIRFAVKNYIGNETLNEVEKLQILNTRMFKFIANKLAHVEILSAVEKSNGSISSYEYEKKLNEIKNFNNSKTNSIIEESL